MSGPVPARVDESAKAVLLGVIDAAVSAGWSLSHICGVLELDRQRAWRWQRRRRRGCLADRPPGGNPVHGILAWEEQAVLELFEQWVPVDLSHRKLAHRGSYLERVWVSPSTVDRILARHGLALAGEPRPPKSVKKPWPDWVEWRPNQLWCWDGSQFERCPAARYAYAIVDIVSRKWITTLLAAEATSVQVKVLFIQALRAEGILDDLDERLEHPEHVDVTEWPHLNRIGDPAVLAAELERVRRHYNSVRLHEGRGDKIRAARRDGLSAADGARRAHHRALRRRQP